MERDNGRVRESPENHNPPPPPLSHKGEMEATMHLEKFIFLIFQELDRLGKRSVLPCAFINTLSHLVSLIPVYLSL